MRLQTFTFVYACLGVHPCLLDNSRRHVIFSRYFRTTNHQTYVLHNNCADQDTSTSERMDTLTGIRLCYSVRVARNTIHLIKIKIKRRSPQALSENYRHCWLAPDNR